MASIRGAPLLELAAQDPRLDTVFVPALADRERHAEAVGMETCLSCHLWWKTRAVPGAFVMTTFPRKSTRDYANGGVSNHREPLPRRYGAWYVTGAKVPPRHMGNQPLIGPHAAAPEATPPPPALTTLAGEDLVRDIDDFLAPTSDIAALVVLEARAARHEPDDPHRWEHRLSAGADADAPVAAGQAPVLTPRVQEAVDELVDYLVFVDEVPLDVVQGDSGFTEWFSAQGPRDGAGRSLRELKLDGRMMRYPLSYTIYSLAFEGMPPAVRQAAYRRLWQVLSVVRPEAKYAHLTAADRRAMLRILRATKTDLPDFFAPTLGAHSRQAGRSKRQSPYRLRAAVAVRLPRPV